jgi:hypothetical protein
MKINRLLHETDLARTALLPKDEKRIQLRRIRDFVPTYSWSPFRHCLPGIFQASKSLIDLPAVSWSDVEAAIKIKCKKHPNWLQGNLQLAQVLFGAHLHARPQRRFQRLRLVPRLQRLPQRLPQSGHQAARGSRTGGVTISASRDDPPQRGLRANKVLALAKVVRYRLPTSVDDSYQLSLEQRRRDCGICSGR